MFDWKNKISFGKSCCFFWNELHNLSFTGRFRDQLWADPLKEFLSCKNWNIEMSNCDCLWYSCLPQGGSSCPHNVILRLQVHGSLQHHPVPQCHPALLSKYNVLSNSYTSLHIVSFESLWMKQGKNNTLLKLQFSYNLRYYFYMRYRRFMNEVATSN